MNYTWRESLIGWSVAFSLKQVFSGDRRDNKIFGKFKQKFKNKYHYKTLQAIVIN